MLDWKLPWLKQYVDAKTTERLPQPALMSMKNYKCVPGGLMIFPEIQHGGVFSILMELSVTKIPTFREKQIVRPRLLI
jgi:hypothetical protein